MRVIGLATSLRASVYTDIPKSYSSKGTKYGSNSHIYKSFISELRRDADEIREIHLSLYLFNNIDLYEELLRLAEKGIKVHIVSIPLSGYDERKIEQAQNIYEKALVDKAIDFRLFPHLYVWYGALYANGGATYSLHVKAGKIDYKNRSKVFLTSANLAPGDPSHSETAVFLNLPAYSPAATAFEVFFNEIEKRAPTLKKYSEVVRKLPVKQEQLLDFCFVGGAKMSKFDAGKMSQAFFSAPFITIGGIGSNHYARKRLVETILSAKKRLFVCSQHIHDISPFDGYVDQNMINALIEAKKRDLKTDVRVLKQVASSGLADKRRAAFVECHLHYAGVSQKANRLIHDKFIIADNTVAFATGNFTATQFGWGQRKMEYKTNVSQELAEKVIEESESFFGTPQGKLKTRISKARTGARKIIVCKDDIFSEVNSFIILKDPAVADQLAKYFDSLWTNKLTANVEILK